MGQHHKRWPPGKPLELARDRAQELVRLSLEGTILPPYIRRVVAETTSVSTGKYPHGSVVLRVELNLSDQVERALHRRHPTFPAISVLREPKMGFTKEAISTLLNRVIEAIEETSHAEEEAQRCALSLSVSLGAVCTHDWDGKDVIFKIQGRASLGTFKEWARKAPEWNRILTSGPP